MEIKKLIAGFILLATTIPSHALVITGGGYSYGFSCNDGEGSSYNFDSSSSFLGAPNNQARDTGSNCPSGLSAGISIITQDVSPGAEALGFDGSFVFSGIANTFVDNSYSDPEAFSYLTFSLNFTLDVASDAFFELDFDFINSGEIDGDLVHVDTSTTIFNLETLHDYDDGIVPLSLTGLTNLAPGNYRLSGRIKNRSRSGDGFQFASLEVDANFISLVPIPTTAWLFGSALLGLAGLSGRTKSA